jgi:transposase
VEYLPAYSPDLNPIKKMWSKIKAVLRALKARTSRALNAAIRKAFRAVTPYDALFWFASFGYSVT